MKFVGGEISEMDETKKAPEVVLQLVNEPTEEELAEIIKKRNQLLESMGYVVPTDGGKIRKRTELDIEKEREEKEKETERIAWLRLFCESSGEEIITFKTKVQVGRDSRCDLRPKGLRISRFHADFVYDGRAWFIEAHSSVNGTWLDGKKLLPGKKTRLHYDHVIDFAHVEKYVFFKQTNTKDKEEKTRSLASADRRQVQNVINLAYQGIAMVVRDVNLPDHIANKYTPGMILYEKAFTDASDRIMGMVTTHRYVILSNHTLHFGQFAQEDHTPDWGLCTTGAGSHFKVLGKHTHKDKHAIILLHLPDNDTWKLFEDVSTSMDQELLELAVKRFEAKCELPPVPELATPQWLDRCKFPIGMSENGELFELE